MIKKMILASVLFLVSSLSFAQSNSQYFQPGVQEPVEEPEIRGTQSSNPVAKRAPEKVKAPKHKVAKKEKADRKFGRQGN